MVKFWWVVKNNLARLEGFEGLGLGCGIEADSNRLPKELAIVQEYDKMLREVGSPYPRSGGWQCSLSPAIEITLDTYKRCRHVWRRLG